jgi:hypothetical protein
MEQIKDKDGRALGWLEDWSKFGEGWQRMLLVTPASVFPC